MVRIAVLVSGGGTNLQALIDAQGRGEIPDGQIAAQTPSPWNGQKRRASPAMSSTGRILRPTRP